MDRQRRHVDYPEICHGIGLLCDLIVSAKDGWRPDAIVAVVRGGLVPATHLCHFLERPIFFICGDVLLDSPGAHHRILVVDEINDTGKAFQRINDKIFNQPPYDLLDVRYASLYTRHTTNFKADYFLNFKPFYLQDAVYQHFPWEKPEG